MISRLKIFIGVVLGACASIALAQQQPVVTVGITQINVGGDVTLGTNTTTIPLAFTGGTTFATPNEAYGPYGTKINVAALGIGTNLVGSFTYSFFVNGISVGVTSTAVAPPVQPVVQWTPPQPGSYFITVKISDGVNTATSLAVRYFATGTVMNSPVTNTLVPLGSSVVLKADATVGGGFIKEIQFYDNGVAIGSADQTIPYSLIYTPGAGAHSVTAQAKDNNDALLTMSAPITLNVITPITPLPSSSISSPTHNSVIGIGSSATTVPVSVDAHSTSGLITKVELYIDGVLFGTKTSYPYTFSWIPSVVGTYNLVALTYDDKNNVVASTTSTSTTSTPAPTTVSIAAPPTVTINSPATGSTVTGGSPLLLTATATTSIVNGVQTKISSVQFFASGTFIGSSTTASSGSTYTLSYTPKPQTDANGQKTPTLLTAIATNDVGLSAVSDPVSLTVTEGGNPPPPPVIGVPPTVSVTSPLNNTTVQVNTPVSLAASASDADGVITAVAFDILTLPGTTIVASISAGSVYPYKGTWTPTALGTYKIQARATDNDSNSVTSSPALTFTVSDSGTAASVTLTNPSNNSSVPVGQPVTLKASVVPGPNAITGVSFWINGVQVGSASQYPYQFVWTPGNLGTYTLKAMVTDSVGNSTSSPAVTVIVGAAAGVTVLTSTATNSQVPQGSSIILSADVNLGQGAIKQIQFYDNGGAIGSADTTAPYSIVFTPSGSAGTVHSLTAQATDNNNVALTASAPLTITVANAVTPLPTVAIITPLDLAKVALPTAGNSIPISIDARSPSGFLTKVEFYIDGQLVGSKAAYPYSFTWTPTFAGVYRLVAVAYDDKNNSVASTVNTVAISAPPSVSITSPTNNATVTGSAITQVTVTATSSNGYPVNVQLFADGKYVGEASITAAGIQGTILYTAAQKTVVDAAGNVTVVATPLYVIASDPLGFATTSSTVSVNVTNGGSSTGSTVIGQRPTVAVTAPLGGTNFPVGALITLSANAADSDGNIVQVIFSANGQTVSTLTAYPYYATWKPLNLGTYAITAKVTDNDGNTVTSAPVTVSVTDSGPSGTSVAITAPVTGAAFTVATETTLRATATDDVAVANVQYFINSQPFGDKILAAPYNLKWTPLAAGTYTIFARATDNVGNQATSASVVVSVNANAAPVVALTSPVTGTTIVSGNSVALAATASDSDGTIKSVQFLANGLVVGTSTAAPYTAAWTPSGPGTYTLAAQATDDSGNITVSSTVQLTVAGNQPPTVSLTSPKIGASVSVGAATTLVATAADADGNVAKVQFYANGTLINQATTTPYQVNWTPTAEGVYRLTAVATDNAGATVTSAIVVVAAVSGLNAVDTVASGLYLNFNTSDSGTFSIINLHGRSVTFIGYVPAAQATSAPKVYYFADAPLDSAGNFQLTNPAGAVIFSGQFSTTGASGSFTADGNSIMFGGTNTTSKANAAPSGYYSGSVTGHPGSLLTGFVGLDGVITVYAQDGAFADAGAAAVSTNGVFTITTRSSNKITGTADPTTGLLTGTITKSGATGADSFTGAQASGSSFSDGSLRNISSRGWVGTGDSVLIAGFVVNGTSPKQVLIRAVGPTLGSMGVTGALANPVLYLNDHNGAPLTFNDNWGTAGATIAATASTVGAQALPVGSLDSAILTTLAPGAYTAQVSGVGNGTGIALVELYDVDNVAAFSSEKMVNISTRGFVGTGDNILIAGFVVNGTSPKKILVRGIGPGLATVGLSNGILADPVLRVVRANGPLIRENDNWGAGNDVGLVVDAAAKIGAFPLVVGSKDAVILMNLPPGVYSAQLSGSGTSTGVGMIEVYEVQ